MKQAQMYVIKRDGRQENVHFDKITSRIKKLCYGLNEQFVDPTIVAQKVCFFIDFHFSNSSTHQINNKK